MNDRSRPNSGAASGAEAPHASASEDRNSEGAPTPEAPPASASSADVPSEASPFSDQPDIDPGPEHDPDNHEAKLERDLEELTAKAQKADEYLELAQRTKADFENFRKRAARETAAAQERGVVKVVRELLPAVDNLDRALAAAEASANSEDLVAGIKLVHNEVLAALARVGVEPFEPLGQPFDPEHHEAVAQQPVDGAEPGTCAEVYQRGYRIGDAVIRPAKVVVAA